MLVLLNTLCGTALERSRMMPKSRNPGMQVYGQDLRPNAQVAIVVEEGEDRRDHRGGKDVGGSTRYRMWQD